MLQAQTCTMQDASRRSSYASWVRSQAPRDITLDNVNITSLGHDDRAPLYVGMGAQNVSYINSRINGRNYGGNPAIYLDAESSGALIQNNELKSDQGAPGAGGREVIAIDGSSNNRIIGNHFASLDRGGVYLYRNCGEGGVARHRSPTNNQIVNNFFEYQSYGEPGEAVDS